MNRVTVVAFVKAKKGKEKDLERALLDLIAPTHREAGCIDYILHRAQESPGVFVFYENWESADRLQEHLNSKHLRGFLSKAEGLLESPPGIQLYDRIS
ncbi:MAG TPA: putative quinol monooxygenase [Acidobacteriota bacterium]|nr:putative quinol monooxygenase [Acidobacteriota bacterium]